MSRCSSSPFLRGNVEVAEHSPDALVLPEATHGRLPVFRLGHAVAGLPEDVRDSLANTSIVIDHQNVHALHSHSPFQPNGRTAVYKTFSSLSIETVEPRRGGVQVEQVQVK